MASLPHDSHDPGRWPALLVALRRTPRPDRARVSAYVSVLQHQAGWEAYQEFLAAHRTWIDGLDRALAAVGAPHQPLVDGPQGLPPAEGIAPPRTPAHALGYLYVLEAFRLGHAVLARRVRGLSESTEERREVDGAWKELARLLADVPVGEHAAVLQGARDAYADWERQVSAALGRLGLGPGARGARAA
jgi:heme oxygenase